MTEQKPPSDPIDDAIKATDRPRYLVRRVGVQNGDEMVFQVPIEFDPDQFETAVASLIELRFLVEQRKAEAQLLVPAQGLVAIDGGRLT